MSIPPSCNALTIGATRTTLRRMGGNRQTVYNWELNASNAGNDWKHQSDDWPCSNLGYTHCNVPGGQMTDFVAENVKAGADSLLVLPLLPFLPHLNFAMQTVVCRRNR